jgi:ABC-type multidrug transport system fused ATPase/permease subunit
VIASAVEASVSISRLLKFFLNEEKDESAVEHVAPVHGVPVRERVSIQQGTFAWDRDSERVILNNINFSVTDKECFAVVGPVGAGKSTFLSAILGDTYKLDGRVTVCGTIAYIPQTPWIMNTTVRENILFGRPFDRHFYEKTLEACGLIQDLESLIAGDATEIGERGINLSGGQKQRVAIARAVYSRADIFLFDDALSAVDAHVGRHIFDHVLGPKGLLKDKTRVLVTHGIQYLPDTNKVMMLAEGKIVEMGTYQELMDKKENLYSLIKEYGKRKNQSSDTIDDPPPEPIKDRSDVIKSVTKDIIKDPNVKTTIITNEDSAKGKVDWAVYRAYAEACGMYTVLAFVLIAIVAQCLSVSQNVLLSMWAQENDRNVQMMQTFDRKSVLPWLIAYGILGLSYSSFVVFQVLFAWVFCGIRSARIMHVNLLENVLRLPQSFFDTTPLGRIMNRFSKDIYTTDEVLPRSFLGYFRTMFIVISVLAVNTIGNPYYLILAFPLGSVYYYCQKYYLSTSRELKRLDSTSRSPIYSNFQETLNGVTSIRAFGQQNRFIQLNANRVDNNQRAYYPSVSSNRWLAVRLEFIGSLIVFGSASAGVLAIYFDKNMSSSIIGLMLVYALSVTQTLNWMVRQSCEIETNIVSVERIKEYTEIPQEAPAIVPHQTPTAEWPSQGSITFQNYAARYRPELDLVIKNLDIHIKPREKIGLVGRTGYCYFT